MIRIPKRQLFSLKLFPILLLVVPLSLFFVYASFLQRDFFIFIAVSLLSGIFILGAFHFRLSRDQAELRLKRFEYMEECNLLEAGIAREQEVIDSIGQKALDYSQLKDFAEKVSTSFSFNDTVRTITAEAGRIFYRQGITVILYLINSRTGEPAIAHSYRNNNPFDIKEKNGDEFDSWVVKTAKPLLVDDTKTDFRFDLEKILSERIVHIRSLMTVPLAVGDNLIGLVRLDSPRPGEFSMEDVRLLSTIADLGAVAIENAQLFERVEDLAIRDSLTGLFLRRYLIDRISQEMSRVLRRKEHLSLILIDLDHFKKYNDSFGHTAGDIVLRLIGMILSDYFANLGDVVCRYGGEEFAVLLPECSKEKALKIAEIVRAKIEARTVVLRRQKTSVTASFGIASFPEDAQGREDLIQKADQALYRAKHQGRNRVEAA